MSRRAWADPVYALLRLADPLKWIALHRAMMIRRVARCGSDVRFTYRAEVLNHSGDPERCRLGEHTSLDGTLEVYERGRLAIGAHSFVGRSRIYAAECVELGKFCLVSDNVAIMDSDLHAMSFRIRETAALRWAGGSFPSVYEGVRSAPVRLADHCWVGFGAIITKGVVLGEGAIVGAGSVVTKSVPPWTIVAGNPAQTVREIPPDDR